MTLRADSLPFQPPDSLAVPSAAQVSQSVRQSRQLFARTLSCWAVDVLALRHTGRDNLMWSIPRAHSSARKAA